MIHDLGIFSSNSGGIETECETDESFEAGEVVVSDVIHFPADGDTCVVVFEYLKLSEAHVSNQSANGLFFAVEVYETVSMTWCSLPLLIDIWYYHIIFIHWNCVVMFIIKT